MRERSRILAIVAVLLLTGMSNAEEKPNLFAGIEIGGKGVKATVLARQPDGSLKRIFADTYNTKLSILQGGSFTPAAITDTTAAISRFIATIQKKYRLPAKRIVVVGSSGLPAARNRNALVAAVKKATGKELRFIDDRAEVELGILGIIPAKERTTALSLDIGSGNTKGGFLTEGGKLAYFAIPLATVTFTQRIKKEAQEKKISFARAASGLREPALTAPMRQAVKNMTGLAERKRVYLSGGAVWAMTSLLKPESVDTLDVALSAADIKAYHALLRKSGGKFPAVDLSKITGAEKRKRAEKEIERVRKAFTVDNLVAGSEILLALAEAFDLPARTVIFPRNAFAGWLSAYLREDRGRRKE